MSVMLIDALNARQGGGQTYLLNLLTRLPEGEPSLIYLLAPEDIGKQVESERVRLLKPWWPVKNGLLRALWEGLFLRRQARQLGASIIFFPGGIVGGEAPLGGRRATMFRNVIPFDLAQRRRYSLGYQRIRNWVLERVMLRSMVDADLVIFLSNYGRSLIERSAGRRIAGAVTIPHGVSPLFREAAGPRPGWVPDHPYLLYVSSFEPYKAQLEVVQAFARVVQHWHEPLSLVFVGPSNTAYAAEVKREIKRLGLADRVLMPGNRPYGELPAAHHHSLIGIFASEAENCPNALLEAMAAGKPILCSRRPPMPEFGGDAVLYFEPSDVEELSSQLLRLLHEPLTRERLGMAAAQWSRRFDWNETARTTWKALQHLQNTTERHVVVHAPNVHVGGGKELLDSLMEVLDRRDDYMAVLDERFGWRAKFRHPLNIVLVRPTLKDRLEAEWHLKTHVGAGSTVLCFGNLPPLFRLKGKVYLYLQNRFLLGGESLADWPWYARARLTLERRWLALRLRNADVIVVQTQTMRALVHERFRRDAIVLPFLPDTVRSPGSAGGKRDPSSAAFVYVASGEPHKNHLRLVQAWRLLGEAGLRPQLWLTLDTARYGRLVDEIEHTASVHGLQITNVGSVSRSELDELYRKADALIYPSMLESYGLPLLEARAAGLPLITGELDYVRDIVDPEETFDPASPLSIARAVKRFMGRPEQRVGGVSAQDFLERLLAEDGS